MFNLTGGDDFPINVNNFRVLNKLLVDKNCVNITCNTCLFKTQFDNRHILCYLVSHGLDPRKSRSTKTEEIRLEFYLKYLLSFYPPEKKLTYLLQQELEEEHET